jgi:DNA-binding XRE family transcriptional regulator
MARVSSKKDKNIYQQTREKLELSREGASELLEWISPERIERIENEKSNPNPDEVLQMADRYKLPRLCNYYCSHQCPIGQEYVPEIKVKDLSQITLELLASLNAMNGKRERLIEITVNGRIDDSEIEDFVHIQEELERISVTVETLQLWSERMVANGIIDQRKYEEYKKRNK